MSRKHKKRCTYCSKREIWQPVIDFEYYYSVSSIGRIMRIAPGENTYVGRILSPSNVLGYRTICFSINGMHTQKRVHCLVAATFIGPCPKGKEVNHKDLNKAHNCVRNLEYVTHLKNVRHAHRHGHIGGKAFPGELNAKAKLTTQDVESIKRKYKRGLTQTAIGKIYGVAHPTIGRIVRGEGWLS